MEKWPVVEVRSAICEGPCIYSIRLIQCSPDWDDGLRVSGPLQSITWKVVTNFWFIMESAKQMLVIILILNNVVAAWRLMPLLIGCTHNIETISYSSVYARSLLGLYRMDQGPSVIAISPEPTLSNGSWNDEHICIWSYRETSIHVNQPKRAIFWCLGRSLKLLKTTQWIGTESQYWTCLLLSGLLRSV